MSEMPEQKLIIFDFDGVIVDTFDLSFYLRKEIMEPNLTRAKFTTYFMGNIWNIEPERIPTEEDVAEYARRYTEGLSQSYLCPGIGEVIRTLARKSPDRKNHLIVVSSNESETIKRYLASKSLLRYFLDALGSDVHTSKAEKIMQTLNALNLSASDAVFITDTVGDIREAKCCGVKSIAAAWGYQPPELLQTASPNALVLRPNELEMAIEEVIGEQSHAWT